MHIPPEAEAGGMAWCRHSGDRSPSRAGPDTVLAPLERVPGRAGCPLGDAIIEGPPRGSYNGRLGHHFAGPSRQTTPGPSPPRLRLASIAGILVVRAIGGAARAPSNRAYNRLGTGIRAGAL